MSFWSELGENFFGGIRDANPCEDQFMAGVNNQPYPVSDQPYDCGQSYFDGQQYGAAHDHHGTVDHGTPDHGTSHHDSGSGHHDHGVSHDGL